MNIGFPSTSFNVYMPYVVGEVGDVGGSLVLALRTLASMGAVIVVDRYSTRRDIDVFRAYIPVAMQARTR